MLLLFLKHYHQSHTTKIYFFVLGNIKPEFCIDWMQTCEAATQLRKTGRVNMGANTSVQHLAAVHLKAGIKDVHFEV
jgi:hypothetical protein